MLPAMKWLFNRLGPHVTYSWIGVVGFMAVVSFAVWYFGITETPI